MDVDKGSKCAVLLLVLAVGISRAQMVTIDSAFRLDQDVLAFTVGEEVAWVNSRGRIIAYVYTRRYNIKSGFETDAAMIIPGTHHFYFYSKRAGLWSDVNTKKFKEFKYGPKRKFLKGGPDAIGRKGDVVYAFKECKMAVRKNWDDWGTPTDMRDAGLPCHVDAAWNEGEDMGLVRGDQLWFWRANGTLDGPEDFNAYYHIPEWNVAPYDGPED